MITILKMISSKIIVFKRCFFCFKIADKIFVDEQEA